MSSIRKPIEEVTVSDFEQFPVWEYVDEEELDDEKVWVRPVHELPVRSLANRVVGTRIRLNNGEERWALMSNMILTNPRNTDHFVTLSIEDSGRRFHLARYHDVDWEERGPEALAEFLGMPLGEVFPISYDISDLAIGHPRVMSSEIPANPTQRLSQDEIIHLALEDENT